jgi:hypothetical protein
MSITQQHYVDTSSGALVFPAPSGENAQKLAVITAQAVLQLSSYIEHKSSDFELVLKNLRSALEAQ